MAGRRSYVAVGTMDSAVKVTGRLSTTNYNGLPISLVNTSMTVTPADPFPRPKHVDSDVAKEFHEAAAPFGVEATHIKGVITGAPHTEISFGTIDHGAMAGVKLQNDPHEGSAMIVNHGTMVPGKPGTHAFIGPNGTLEVDHAIDVSSLPRHPDQALAIAAAKQVLGSKLDKKDRLLTDPTEPLAEFVAKEMPDAKILKIKKPTDDKTHYVNADPTDIVKKAIDVLKKTAPTNITITGNITGGVLTTTLEPRVPQSSDDVKVKFPVDVHHVKRTAEGLLMERLHRETHEVHATTGAVSDSGSSSDEEEEEEEEASTGNNDDDDDDGEGSDSDVESGKSGKPGKPGKHDRETKQTKKPHKNCELKSHHRS